jgi:hypothetical protein
VIHLVKSNKCEGQIKVICEDSGIQISSNINISKIAICEHVALASLRQMNQSEKGRERIKNIVAVLSCWVMD